MTTAKLAVNRATYLLRDHAFLRGTARSPAFQSFFFSSRRRHTRSVSAFLLNRSSDLGADIAFDADPKFFACLVRFESSWFRLPSRLPMMFILWMVAMMVVIIPSRTV